MSIEITASQAPHDTQKRSVIEAIFRGLRQTCPSCGKGALFRQYLKVADSCSACDQELHHHRADDAPAYFTMLIIGHLVVAGVLAVEMEFSPPLWVHAVLWGPILVISSLLILPRIKGALVGLQWALRMHGFAGKNATDPSQPLAYQPIQESSRTTL